MKYLKIHKLLWFIIVVAFTLLEGAVIVLYYIIFLIWNFRYPKDLWAVFHSAEHDYENHWGDIHTRTKTFLKRLFGDINVHGHECIRALCN